MTHLLKLTTKNISRHRATVLLAGTDNAESLANALKGEMASVVTLDGITYVYLENEAIADTLAEAYGGKVIRP